MIFANQATIGGKVVRDPMFSKTKSDKSVCKIIVVVEKTVGGTTKRADFIPIALWGKKADIAKDTIQKGDGLVVVGSVAQERWETANGEKRSRIVLQADRFWPMHGENHEYPDDEDDESEDYSIFDEEQEKQFDKVSSDF